MPRDRRCGRGVSCFAEGVAAEAFGVSDQRALIRFEKRMVDFGK